MGGDNTHLSQLGGISALSQGLLISLRPRGSRRGPAGSIRGQLDGVVFVGGHRPVAAQRVKQALLHGARITLPLQNSTLTNAESQETNSGRPGRLVTDPPVGLSPRGLLNSRKPGFI